jgi:hypothetical protein
MRAILFICLLGLGACADVPVLEDRIDQAARDAPFPALINIDPLLAEANAAPPAAQITSNVNAQIASLRARANRLRGPVIAAPDRARMARGVALPVPFR